MFTHWNPKCTSGQFTALWPMNICGLGVPGNQQCWELGVKPAHPLQKGILKWVKLSVSEEPSGPVILVLLFQGHVCTRLHLVLWAAYDFLFWGWGHLKCLTGSRTGIFILPLRKIKLYNLRWVNSVWSVYLETGTSLCPFRREKNLEINIFTLTSLSLRT